MIVREKMAEKDKRISEIRSLIRKLSNSEKKLT